VAARSSSAGSRALVSAAAWVRVKGRYRALLAARECVSEEEPSDQFRHPQVRENEIELGDVLDLGA